MAELTDKQKRDRVGIIVERQRKSLDWMDSNFYGQFLETFKAYKCERDPEKDPVDPTKVDTEASSLAMPDTWSSVRRQSARITAQIPNLRFHARDRNDAELVSRTLMYQWDKGGVQRVQKRHATQALLFGWSVRPWHWSSEVYPRTKRVNPLDPNLDPIVKQQICDSYQIPAEVAADPVNWAMAMSGMLSKYSRGGMLPVEYRYKAYEGPRTDFLLLADCFPQPNFQSLQSSDWFIVERRRNKDWLLNFLKQYPEASDGVEKVLEKYPNGTEWEIEHGSEKENLRQRLLGAIDRVEHPDTHSMFDSKTHHWTVQECWRPGRTPGVDYSVEADIFLHSMEGPEFPYMLDGKIPFSELVLIDDILCGIGDSTARIMRGLQQMHDRQVNTRFDLTNNICRPLIGTTSDNLYENPDLVKRFKGFRLVKMDRQGELWVQGEQAAMAAVAVSLQDESSVMRMFQMLTGESNMSMMADVDPQQSRTATGARLMAYQQDVLTKDAVDMFNLALNADAEMMFLLNRSEMGDAIEFDPAPYNRSYGAGADFFKGAWIKAEPDLFQIDGEVTAEIGSTLADDDEGNVTKARELFQVSTAYPQLFNAEKARDNLLIALGKGKELDEWKAPPPQPPPPPELKTSLSVSAKMEMLPPPVQQSVMEHAGLVPPAGGPPGAQMGAPPTEGGPPAPAGPPPNGQPPPPPEEQNPMLAASSLAAAQGHSPLATGMPQ